MLLCSRDESIIEQVESLGFDLRGTGSSLNLEFTDDNADSHTFVNLEQGGVWTYLLKRDRELLGADATTEFRNQTNQFGRFYREDQLSKADSSGCRVKYSQLNDSVAGFTAFLDRYRSRINELVQPV